MYDLKGEESVKRAALFVIVSWFSNPGFCQLPQNYERQAISRINKKNWEKAEQLLQKSIRKDATNPEAKYVLAGLFLISDYPKFNIDSSNYYLQIAINDYNNSTERAKERLLNFPLDSAILKSLQLKIDSAAFKRAVELNSEKDYNNFLENYPQTKEAEKAIELRDNVAFTNALKLNTYKGFQEYVQKYPNSHKVNEAKKYFEKLLYNEQTKEGKLSSYTSFLKDHPNTNFRYEIDKNIFEISTASGTLESFQLFLNQYPKSNFYKKAINILSYLQDNNQTLSDSLSEVAILNKNYWIPILKDNKFGFMDQNGTETLSPRFESIEPSYLCGNITTEYLVTANGVVSRTGKIILNSDASVIEELGFGFIKIKTTNCWNLIHKSGYLIVADCLQDAKVVGSHFLAIKEKNKWSLLTFSGRLLIPASFDDIYAEGELIVLVRSGKKVLKTTTDVAELANNNPLKENFVFDNVRNLGQGHYQVSNGSLQGVLSDKLEYVVSLGRQVISQSPYGFLQEQNRKVKTTGISKEVDKNEYVSVSFYSDWIKLKEKNNLILYDGKNKRIIASNLDSIWFDNKLAFAIKDDSLTVHLDLSKSITLESTIEIKFIKSIDSVRFFYANDKKKKTVVEIATGKKLFSVKASYIQYLGNNVFLIEDENKKGLVNESGKVLLPNEYSAIVLSNKNYVSLLKDKKFGLFDLKTKVLIKPIYERNIIPYSSEKLIAFKNGSYGFVSWKLKDESKFEFDEVNYWNDSVALVKKDAYWMFYNIYERKIGANMIKDFRFVTNTEKEKVIIIHSDNFYGLVSNRKGNILAATYNDIINLGTEENPIYFTEKFVQEADIHIVIYYNSDGKLLRKQAYETKEYEKIYCDER